MKLLKVEPKENETLLTFSAHPEEIEVLMGFSLNFLISAGLSAVSSEEEEEGEWEQMELFTGVQKH